MPGLVLRVLWHVVPRHAVRQLRLVRDAPVGLQPVVVRRRHAPVLRHQRHEQPRRALGVVLVVVVHARRRIVRRPPELLRRVLLRRAAAVGVLLGVLVVTRRHRRGSRGNERITARALSYGHSTGRQRLTLAKTLARLFTRVSGVVARISLRRDWT